VFGGFIIGFDHDTPKTFEDQYRFITDAGIQTAMIGLLTAPPRTPLYARMKREGRLREIGDELDNTSLRTNVIPKTMSDDEMSGLFAGIYRRLLTDAGIRLRIHNKARHLAAPSYRGGYTFGQSMGIVSRLLLRGILPGGFGRTYHFLRSLSLHRPSLIPLEIADWITGLSMRDFARNHLWAAPSGSASDSHLLDSVQAAIARYLRQGEIWVTRQTAIPNLTIHLGDALSRRFFRSAAPQLRRLMEDSRARLTLAVDGMPARYMKQLERLLSRLAGHGDRIFVVLSESLRQRVTIDLSAFNLVLVPAAGA
jgi:hypothetical protein